MTEEFGINHRPYEPINLPDEMQTSFLDYAMSVIVSRALPDVRDGLKPVQRRILYGMYELGVTPDKPHKKSARIVGDVMGKYHPHGDSAIYDAMVRMAQPFSYRQMLVDGHGNFGSVDGDGAAAMRYTEARMSRIALEMLRDINKNTIDFQNNYSNEEREPVVLPARFPNLLVNGASGIAVGMATNIPPHNLGEVIDAAILLMHNPEVSVSELMEVLPGPDFPTGAIVMGKMGIRKAYETGKGKILLRSKVDIEQLENNRERIVITEIPYAVNKANLVKRIAELAHDKRIDGITYANDESGREGMRIVIEVRRDTSANVVLNNLYKMTPLQVTFGINMLAIDHGVPKIMGLKDILAKYLDHQVEVIRRRLEYEKKKAEDRAHILEGLRVALDHIDDIINIIRNSPDGETAKQLLISNYKLTDIQAQAILDMRLVRLTGLEREKIDNEYSDLLVLIERLNEILSSQARIYEIIEDELIDIKQRFADPRRTELRADELIDINDEELIEEENIVIALTANGYIKRMTEDEFSVQNRGGKGVKGMGVGDDDEIKSLISCSTHDTILFFTNYGKVYSTRGFEIPEYGRTAKGLPVINMININPEEEVKAVIAVNQNKNVKDKEYYLFFATRSGTVKRTRTSEYYNIRTNGLIAMNLKENDELVAVLKTDGTKPIILASHQGYAMTFMESDVREMGRTATGVRGMRLRDGDYVIAADILSKDKKVLVISEKGYGKKASSEEYSIKNRGGLGLITAKLSDKTGNLANMLVVSDDDEILIMTNNGVAIRMKVDAISQTSRVTMGVRLIRLDDNAKVSSITTIYQTDDEIDKITEEESVEDVPIDSIELESMDAFDDIEKIEDTDFQSDK